jgi:hypothetical protein
MLQVNRRTRTIFRERNAADRVGAVRDAFTDLVVRSADCYLLKPIERRNFRVKPLVLAYTLRRA